MAIQTTSPVLEEEIGGQPRRLLLRNGEIERFEVQYAPFGIFAFWDQLYGHGGAPQVRHVRDLIALGLVGGGMSDRMADETVAALGPDQNPRLREIAQRLLGVTFYPEALTRADKKKEGGSRVGRKAATGATAPKPASGTSAA
ncbi:GTA-gp10 family protein [Pseudoroseicyclus aestuarii]|uniref:Tail tube GTA-gp10-like protein n=1 Tax=Pseudoroseicyclus aestuarii TaxID=1795041 RepID=A0A318SLW1_9RHOB|nr:GTA-gp10 family protein [Pseudoroseicyclus aestuarii]PYE80814.1 tail tube GTA-gp10-like protein [Pseudoroseicyclus aestuarii]